MKGIPGPKLAILILGITVDSQLTRMMTQVCIWHRADRVINDRRSNPDCYLLLDDLNHFKFVCDQFHIFRKMPFAGEKPLMFSLPVFKA